MPLTFPDGTKAELEYPPKLHLAAMGARPGVAVSSRKGAGDGREIGLAFGTPHASIRNGDRPAGCYRGRLGQVETWETSTDEISRWVIFPMRSWTAYFGYWPESGFDEDDVPLWAKRLGGRETKDGWVVIDPAEPLQFGWNFGGTKRPTMETDMMFGGLDPRGVLLWPLNCSKEGPPPSADTIRDKQKFASWCLGDVLEVHVYSGTGEFIRAVLEGLSVRSLDSAFDLKQYAIVP